MKELPDCKKTDTNMFFFSQKCISDNVCNQSLISSNKRKGVPKFFRPYVHLIFIISHL